MPLYDWECPKCGLKEERIVPHTRQAVSCPKCKSAMFKQISAPGGYQMKGDNSASVKPKGSGSWRRK